MSLFRRFLTRTNLYYRPVHFFSTSTPHRFLTDQVTFSDECLKQIVKKTKDRPNQLLRIEIEGGVGCSGYKYIFKFDDAIGEEDYVFEKDNKKYAVIDELTLNMIKGAKIDFEELMVRAGFVVNDNPNAEKSCGCKVSFSPKATPSL